jgi:D-glucosaminate-6-phosphate ammonia-lyase
MKPRKTAWVALLWSASAFAADVVGTWNLMVTTQAGTGTPTLVLAQDGENLTGVYTGRFGTSPVTGTIKGNAIEFHFTVTGPMGSGEVSYSGTVDGSTMSGDMKIGEMGGGTFTAKRP